MDHTVHGPVLTSTAKRACQTGLCATRGPVLPAAGAEVRGQHAPFPCTGPKQAQAERKVVARGRAVRQGGALGHSPSRKRAPHPTFPGGAGPCCTGLLRREGQHPLRAPSQPRVKPVLPGTGAHETRSSRGQRLRLAGREQRAIERAELRRAGSYRLLHLPNAQPRTSAGAPTHGQAA